METKMVLASMERQLTPSHGMLAYSYAERILMHVLSCSRTSLYLQKNQTVTTRQYEAITAITSRCVAHEPLEYILGKAYFYDRFFFISPEVLIPRPDTEVLVEQVLAHEKETSRFFAEVGIGSGIISCILTEKNPGWCCVGIDRSGEALAVSAANRTTGQIFLLQSDALATIKTVHRFDFIVSNPPYIPSGEIGRLDVSVRDFEPRCALDGGSDGLEFYRSFAEYAPNVLKPGGRLYCEIGYDQMDAVAGLFAGDIWEKPLFYRDLAGHSRVLRVRLSDTGVQS
jgi:release factor glutamine methyltransferase